MMLRLIKSTSCPNGANLNKNSFLHKMFTTVAKYSQILESTLSNGTAIAKINKKKGSIAIALKLDNGMYTPLVRQDVNSAFFTNCGLCPVTLEKALGPSTIDSITLPVTPTKPSYRHLPLHLSSTTPSTILTLALSGECPCR